MPKFVVGLDPAVKHLGVCVIDTETLRCFLYCLNTPSSEGRFDDFYDRSMSQALALQDYLSKFQGDKVYITETPPPQGTHAPALWGLDYLLVSALEGDVHLASPLRIHSIFDSGKDKKVVRDRALALASQWGLQLFSVGKTRLSVSTDESDALALALWLMYHQVPGLKLLPSGCKKASWDYRFIPSSQQRTFTGKSQRLFR